MKTAKVILSAALLVFICGCVICSFYPLYNENDLFPNTLLLGIWTDGDGTEWNFEYAYSGEKIPENIDSTTYILKQKYEGEEIHDSGHFSVHVIKLGENYFLDFYPEKFNDDPFLKNFHIMPVHTFARLKVEKNILEIRWFDQEWLRDLLEEKKEKIRHESNENYILLTAGAAELQKLVNKYADDEKAFENGLKADLTRK